MSHKKIGIGIEISDRSIIGNSKEKSRKFIKIELYLEDIIEKCSKIFLNHYLIENSRKFKIRCCMSQF